MDTKWTSEDPLDHAAAGVVKLFSPRRGNVYSDNDRYLTVRLDHDKASFPVSVSKAPTALALDVSYRALFQELRPGVMTRAPDGVSCSS
jgi:hypothetical protein